MTKTVGWLNGYVCVNYPDLLTDVERARLEALLTQRMADYAAQERDETASSYAKILRRQTDLNRSAVTKALKMVGSAY